MSPTKTTTPVGNGDIPTVIESELIVLPGSETDSSHGADVRIMERRADVMSATYRRRRQVVGVIAVIVLLFAGAVAAVYSPILEVRTIDIVGTPQLDAAEFADATGDALGDPIMFVDTDAAESALRADPRFERVAITRELPSSLVVRIVEREPLAVVSGPNVSVVVGEGGVVIALATGGELLRQIEVETDPPAEVGDTVPPELDQAIGVVAALSYDVAVQVDLVTIPDDGELVFHLTSSATVLFGSVDDADRKLLALRTMLGPQIDTSNICELDVRVPALPTMRRNPDCDDGFGGGRAPSETPPDTVE